MWDSHLDLACKPPAFCLRRWEEILVKKGDGSVSNMLMHESEDLNLIPQNPQRKVGCKLQCWEDLGRRIPGAFWLPAYPAQPVNSRFSEGQCLKKIRQSDSRSHPTLTTGLSSKHAHTHTCASMDIGSFSASQ